MSNIINNRRARRALQAGAILAAVGTGYVVRDVRVDAQGGTTSVPPTQVTPVVETAATRDAAATQNAFVEVSKAVQPAVVTIRTVVARTPASGPGSAPRGRRPLPRSPFGEEQGGAEPFGDFQQFFKQFQREFGQGGEEGFQPNSWAGRVLREKAQAKWQEIQSGRGGGLGSGMIYRSDGLILTNAHVVKGADTVSVTLSGPDGRPGRVFEKAKVLGRDERTDIAVVKIEGTGFPTVKLGDSDDVRAGDWAIAVGNPFGLDHSLTVGVISAKGREVPLASGGDTRTDYLQTDASINPGNSGGPLLDIYGRVIGVNNAIYSESGGNQGIGFAIPVNTARFVADQISKQGRVRRGYLGVRIGTMEREGAAFELDPNTKGVLISAVADPQGPGAKAGLKPGDVVTKLNGKTVTTSRELQNGVGNSPIGSTITLDVLRQGRTIQLTAVVQELKDTPERQANAPEQDRATRGGSTTGTALPIPGMKARNLSPEVARALGIDETRGIVITDVAEDSPGGEAGLKRGDIIEQVAQTPVSTVAELQTRINAVLARQTGETKQVALGVNSGGERNIVIITIQNDAR